MFDALNNACVLGRGEGCLGGSCDVGGDVCLCGVCGGDVCLDNVCGNVGDISVMIGGVMGFSGHVVSISCLRCGFCLCGSVVGGCILWCVG